jgi:hypothetical protein
MNDNRPVWKCAATIGGVALTASSLWLNAEHIAHAEGWQSPLVLAGVVVTICAAATPPLAERCQKEGAWLKAICLWLFFAAAVAFSLTASISRTSGHRDNEVATLESGNLRSRLAQEAYRTALECRTACRDFGTSGCRKAETALQAARNGLKAASPVRASDPGAQRLAAVLNVSEASIALYSPLVLPIALELGGFLLLAVGLSPRARRHQPENAGEFRERKISFSSEPAENLNVPQEHIDEKPKKKPGRPKGAKDSKPRKTPERPKLRAVA